MADQSTTSHVYPSANDVHGALATGWGKTHYELNMASYLVASLHPYNFIRSGGKIPASSGTLSITVPACTAFIDGRYVAVNAQSVTVGASVTTYLFLKLLKDANSNVSSVAYETNTSGTYPANSILMCTLVSNGSSITSTADRRTFHRVGIIDSFSGPEDSIPQGSLACFGQAVSRTTYANLHDLYARAAYPYGNGDGSTTFNVPDERGYIEVGKDNMGGSAASRITSASTNGANSTTLGGVGGAQTHTLVTEEMPAHGHNVHGGFAGPGSTHVVTIIANSVGSTQDGAIVVSTGGDGAHSNTQPWRAVNKIVWY
jgi:microcystin-dependent protein